VWSDYFFLFIYGAGVEPSRLLLRPLIGLLYQPLLIDGDDYGAVSGMNEWQGKPKYLEETYPNVALSTTDPTWLDPRSNHGHRGGKPGSNSLSYGTAVWRKRAQNSFVVIRSKQTTVRNRTSGYSGAESWKPSTVVMMLLYLSTARKTNRTLPLRNLAIVCRGLGRAVAQVVSRQFPIIAARVRARAK
jgi:hypothetical protein